MKRFIFAAILAASAMTWHIRCDHEDPDEDSKLQNETQARKIFENRIWMAGDEETVHAFVFLTNEQMGLYAKQSPWAESRELFLWSFESSKTRGIWYNVEIPNRGLDSLVGARVWECDDEPDFELCAEFSDHNVFGSQRFYSRWDMTVDSKSEADRNLKMEIAFAVLNSGI